MPGVYESFYKLTTDPFRLSPDHRFSFGHPSYTKAKAYMQYALQRGEGFIMVTGAPGTGKTTLINDMLSQIDETRVTVVSLLSTRLRPDDMLHMVATTLGLQCDESRKSALLVKIKEALTQQHRMQRRVVLMVDEAQDLSANVLEELRLLSNIQLGSQLLLQVFLVGQEPLVKLVRKPDMEHLRQRIIAATHLDPLSIEDTAAFVIYRLKRAGWQGDPVITSNALESIYDFSGGIPRRINLICSRLLFFGAVEEKHRLDQPDVEMVIEGMQEEMLFGDERPPRRQRPSPAEAGSQPGGPDRPAGAVPAAVRQAMAGPVAFAVPDRALEQPDPAVPLSTFFDVGAGPDEPNQAQGRRRVEPRFDLEQVNESDGRQSLGTRSREGAGDDLPWDVGLPPDLEPDAGDLTKHRHDAGVSAGGLSRDLSVEATQPQTDSDESFTPGGHKASKRKRKPGGGLLMVLLLAVAAAAFLYDYQRPVFDDGDWWLRLTVWLEQQGASFLLPARRDDSAGVVEIAEDSGGPAPAGSGVKPRVAGWIETGPTVSEDPAIPGAGEIPPEPATRVSGTDGSVVDILGGRAPAGDPAGQASHAAVPGTAVADAEVASDLPPDDGGAREASAGDPLSGTGGGEPGDGALAMGEGFAESRQAIAFNAMELDQIPPRPAAEAAAKRQTSLAVVAPAETAPRVAVNEADRPEDGSTVAESVEPGVAEIRWRSGEGEGPAESQDAPVVSRSRRAPQSELAILKYDPGVGTGSVAPSMGALAMSNGGVSLQGREKSLYEIGEIKSQLMNGGWSVFGKPAVLLPSVINHCEDTGARILCWTAPQNSEASAGNPVYQTETTIDGFSPKGTFRVRYRIMETSMRLSEADLADGRQVKLTPDWKLLERETTCHIIHSSLIRCQGGEEGVFSYRKVL